MFTTIIHPIRVALNLSITEYCVLAEVYSLSKNNERGGWCWKSKKNIALSLSVSESRVYRHLNTLEKKGLIERNQHGHTRTTDEWNDMMSRKDYYIGLKNGDNSFISGAPSGNKGVCQNDSTTVKMTEGVCQNDSRDTVKMTYKNNIENNNKNYIVSKDTIETTSQEKTFKKNSEEKNSSLLDLNKTQKEKSSAKKEKGYGRSDINNMLAALKEMLGIEAFADSRNERNIGKHLVDLMGRVGREEFRRRLNVVLKDDFKRKNCNKIRYLYGELKSVPVKNIKPKIVEL